MPDSPNHPHTLAQTTSAEVARVVRHAAQVIEESRRQVDRAQEVMRRIKLDHPDPTTKPRPPTQR
ncbi:MAG TPA: hypothetical protein VIL65_18110 [Beijerinckiaceae bacterium]|jgi:hypothetical protein